MRFKRVLWFVFALKMIMFGNYGETSARKDRFFQFKNQLKNVNNSVSGGKYTNNTAKDNDFDDESITQVISGIPVLDHRYKFVAYVFDKKNDENICTASILEARWIITAAHCVFNFRTDEIFIGLGSNNIVDTVLVPVEEIIVHPYFDENNLYIGNDVALIKLCKRLDETFDKIRDKPVSYDFIRLNTASKSLDIEYNYLTVVGWGSMTPISEESSGHYPYQMMEAQVQIKNRSECLEKIHGEEDFGPSLYCTWGQESRTCVVSISLFV